MAWRRVGRIFVPNGERPFLISHASVPFAEPIQGGLHRIWFSPRDAQNRSHIAWLVVDLQRPENILELASEPALGIGPPGAFDDQGAMMSWLTHVGDTQRLYYIGWNVRAPVPFHVSIGLAERQAQDGWHRHAGPVLDRCTADPWFCSNPCVLWDGTAWRMWYLAGLGWEEIGGRWSPSYHVCHAYSADGVTWDDRGRVVLPLEGDEFAIARPSVLHDASGYTMWFSARTRARPYRLGAARSQDGLAWVRAPELADLSPADAGWDSEMVAYPHVIDSGGTRWMLYCGNGFGRTGFGLAVWA